MTRTTNRNTARAAADDSRRAGEASRGLSRKQWQPWRRSLRRTHRAIDSSMGLLDSSRRVIAASETFATKRPVRASREYQRVSSWLSRATAQLERAVRGLRDTVDDAARAPEGAAEVPGRLIDATARWIDSAARMAELSDRLDQASSELLDSARRGAISIDLSDDQPERAEAFGNALAPFLTPSRSVQRTLTDGRHRIRFISARRMRFVCRTAAAAVRQVFRGRAPPHVSTVRSNHSS